MLWRNLLINFFGELTMLIFFPSRDAARKATIGKFVDNGQDAPKGSRYARKVSGISGNAHQRKIALKRAMRVCNGI
jgi:hypothetical protein